MTMTPHGPELIGALEGATSLLVLMLVCTCVAGVLDQRFDLRLLGIAQESFSWRQVLREIRSVVLLPVVIGALLGSIFALPTLLTLTLASFIMSVLFMRVADQFRRP